MEQPGEIIISFVRDALARYPLSTSRDIYKLLYQAFHGAEHAISDIADARRWLEDEWSGLNSVAESELHLFEDIHIEGITPGLYRINLLPGKLAGLDIGSILTEFLRTALEFPTAWPGPDDNLHGAFRRAWKNLGNAIERGQIELEATDFREITSLAESNNWPALHHSDVYREYYQPHYRLIMDPSGILPGPDFPL